MVSVVGVYKSLVHVLMRLSGLRPSLVEVEPGTVLNIWAPARTGPNPKPAVVLLHGFFADGAMTWQFQVPSLARNYAVYVPDFVFFGASTTAGPRRSPEFQAECVAEALTRLGVRRCAAVGVSYGAMVGFAMAVSRPYLVESMVVTNSVTALTESITDVALHRIGGFSKWSEVLLPTTVDGLKVMKKLCTYKFPWLPQFVYKDALKTMFEHRKEKEELLEALVISDTKFTVPNHPKRVHFLCGAEDTIFNLEVVNSMNEQLGKRSTVELIEEAGHLVPLERPVVYNNLLNKALKSMSQHKNGHNLSGK